MKTYWRIVTGVAAWLASGIVVVAQVPTDQHAYDAWKLTQVLPPAPVVITPEMLDVPPAGSRNGCDCWVEPDASYTTINNNSQWNASGWHNADDGSHGPLAIPFNFQLYGQNYSSAYININGNVSFGQAYPQFSAAGFPVNGFAMVAPFWADVDLRGPGAANNIVQYKITPTAMYVNWTRVGYYSMQTDKVNTFQVIVTNGTDPVVPNGANVSFCYQDMQWTTGIASGGVNGFGGTPANVGSNKGDGVNYMQFGRFDHPGVDYDGPFGVADGVDWLDDKHFMFATDITTANVPPVVSSQTVCDSMVLCVGEPATLEVVFLSPEPSQTTVASSSAPTLSNYAEVLNTSGVSAQITSEFTPQLADVGFHNVTFEATDNGSPVMTTTFTVVVEVQMGLVLDTIAHAVCSNAGATLLLPLLPGMPAGGSWTDPSGAAHGGAFHPAVDDPGYYTYLMDAASGCPSLGTLDMAVMQAANAGDDNAMVLCTSDAPVDLTTLLGGAQDPGGHWTSPAGPAFTGLLDPAFHGTGAYRYVAPGTMPCLNDTATVAITVNQAVDPGQAASMTLCTDAPPLDMLGALNGTPDATGTWTGPGGGASSGTFLAADGPDGIYTYTVTGSAPCSTLSTTLTLATHPRPWAGSDAAVVRCADAASVDLFGQLGGGPDLNGHWHAPGSIPHGGTLDPGADMDGEYLHIVPGTAECAHLIDTAVVTVTINPLPEVAFSLEPEAGCIPLDVSFTNNTPAQYLGGTSTWTLGDGTASAMEAGLDHTYTGSGHYAVILTVTTPQGCTDQLMQLQAVLAEEPAAPIFHHDPEVGTEGNSTLLFHADDPVAVAFVWTIDGLPAGNGRTMEHAFMDQLGGDYEVCLRVEDRYGCADSLCKTVSVVVPSISIPNAFTPDGDGINEVFNPVVLDVVPDQYLFEVYDRWGRAVFGTERVDQGWDGRHASGGEILPQGVYVWRLQYLPAFTADKVERRGTITLIK